MAQTESLISVLQGMKLNPDRKPQVDIEKSKCESSYLADIQNIELNMRSMMSLMNDFASPERTFTMTNTVSNQRPKSLARPINPALQRPRSYNPVGSNMTFPVAAPPQDGVSTSLLTHVWPKSRMLFAIVSNMAKRGQLATPEE